MGTVFYERGTPVNGVGAREGAAAEGHGHQDRKFTTQSDHISNCKSFSTNRNRSIQF